MTTDGQRPDYRNTNLTSAGDPKRASKLETLVTQRARMIDVDTGLTTPKKRVFKSNTAKVAQKILTKAEGIKGGKHWVGSLR